MSRKTHLISSTLGVMALLLMATSSNAQLQMKPTPTPTPLSAPTGGPGSIPGGARVISGAQKVKAAKITANTRIPIDLTNLSQPTGTPPKILGTIYGSFHNIDPATGNTSNSHTPTLSGMSMYNFIGIADVNNTVYGLTTAYSPQPYPYQSRLFTIDVANNTLSPGNPLTLSGNTWICGKEGDLTYDKVSGQMYATCYDGVWKLVTISLAGNVTVVGNMPVGGAFTGLAFGPPGKLYALDSLGRKLWTLNQSDLSLSTMVPLVPYAGQQLSNTSQSGALGFSPRGGLFASFGGDMMTIDPATGVTFVFANGNGANSGLIVTGGAGPVTQQ
jgi:hypothetical protein